MKILLVEDNPVDQLIVTKIFRANQLDVVSFPDAVHAMNWAHLNKPDVLVADYKLPGPDGILLTQQMRQLHPTCTIIVISSRFAKNSRLVINAFRQGADDAFEKPINADEFMPLFWGAVMRRRSVKNTGNREQAQCGELYIDRVQRQALWYGEELRLTPTEFELLAYFAERPDQALSAHELYGISSSDHASPAEEKKRLLYYIQNLRGKLSRNGRYSRNHIITIRAHGYKWSIEGEAQDSEESSA